MEEMNYINTRSSEAGCELIESLSDEKFKPEEDIDRKWARCRNCHYKIALLAEKININDAQSHIFKNPAGIFFRVICFSKAPGSIDISDYTEENSWFAGYSWSITICRSCNNHLGWHYESGSEQFYGLIADRLSGV